MAAENRPRLRPLHAHTRCGCVAQDGQLVSFTEVEGVPELSNGKPHRIMNVKVGVAVTVPAAALDFVRRCWGSQRRAGPVLLAFSGPLQLVTGLRLAQAAGRAGL